MLFAVLIIAVFVVLIGGVLIGNDALTISSERSPLGGFLVLIGLAAVIGAIFDMIF